MKKYILSWASTLLLILYGLTCQAQSVQDKNLYDIKLNTNEDPKTGLVTLTFDIALKRSDANNIESVSFQLPSGAGVLTSNKNNVYKGHSGKKYVIESNVKEPFHSVRFVGVGGKKANSKMKANKDTFEYMLSAIEYATMANLKVSLTATTASGSITEEHTISLNNKNKVSAKVNTVTPQATCGAISMSGPDKVCPGERVTYAIEYAPGYTSRNTQFQWSVPEFGPDGEPSNWQLIPTGEPNTVTVVVGNVSGTVSATVTSQTCGIQVLTKGTTLGDRIETGINVVNGTQSGKEEFRPGDVMVFNATASTNRDKREYDYNWEVPIDWTIVSGQGTTQLILIAGQTEGVVELFVSSKADVRYCGLGYAWVELIREGNGTCEKPDLVVDIPDEVCQDPARRYTFSVKNPDPAGKIKYQFFLPDEFKVVSQAYGSVTVSVNSPVADTTLYVTVVAVNANNCGAEAVCEPVRVVECDPCTTPAVSLIAPDTVCNISNETYTFRVAEPQAGVTYTFNLPEGFFIVDSTSTSVTVQIAVDEEESPLPFTVPVSVTATSECGNATASAYVVVANCEPGNPLPVTLTRFDGSFSSGGVTLNWETATEINNERFEVERSANGIDFLKVGEVKGNGNSSVVLKYSFTDKQPLAGTLYYRLKQVDYDGAYEYSKVIAVESKAVSTGTFKVSLFPNPAQGAQVNARFEGLPQNASEVMVRVVDMNGRVLHTATLPAGSQEVNLGLGSLGLRQGMYMVTLSAGGQNVVQRLVIQ